jgi:hypothetical protein
MKSSATPTASDIPTDITNPVRVSAEGLNAAEPAVAAGRDGAVYVAWVGHGAGKEADVWLTRVEGATKRPNAESARVNRTPGEATRPVSRSRRTARSTSLGLRAQARAVRQRRSTSPLRATGGEVSASP